MKGINEKLASGNVPSIKAGNISIRGFDRLNPDTMGVPAYDEATRTFSMSVKGGETEFHFWAGGIRYEKTTTQSKVWDNVTGSYLFYFDTSGVLQATEKSIVTHDIFVVSAICGVVYWNALTGKAIVQASDEQHGIIMDGDSHFNKHMADGLKWGRVGGVATGFADASDVYTKITAGWYFDEDILLTIAEITAMPFMYLSGDISANGGWVETTPDLKIGHIASGDTYISINTHTGTTYGLTESTTSTDYVIYLILATNDVNNSHKKIIGQNAYASRSLARAALKSEALGVELLGLPGAEMKFAYAYIAKRDGTLEDDGAGNPLVDLRLLHDYNLL